MGPIYFILFVYFFKGNGKFLPLHSVSSCTTLQLTNRRRKKMYVYCMQCSGTAHNVNLSLASLEEVFWPAVY